MDEHTDPLLDPDKTFFVNVHPIKLEQVKAAKTRWYSVAFLMSAGMPKNEAKKLSKQLCPHFYGGSPRNSL